MMVSMATWMVGTAANSTSPAHTVATAAGGMLGFTIFGFMMDFYGVIIRPEHAEFSWKKKIRESHLHINCDAHVVTAMLQILSVTFIFNFEVQMIVLLCETVIVVCIIAVILAKVNNAPDNNYASCSCSSWRSTLIPGNIISTQ